MNKTAFMTMDVESLYDSELFKQKLKYDKNFSYEDDLKSYVDLLNKYNIKGTFFTVASSLDMAYDSLMYAKNTGHEIAIHGYMHTSPFEQTNEEFKESIQTGKQLIEDRLGVKIKGYRAPCFGIDEDKIKIIKDLGFKYDSSNLSFHLAKKSGGIDLSSYDKKADIIAYKDGFYEFSLSKVKAYSGHLPVSGGGYIRLVPWFVIKYYIKKYIKSADSYVFYVHPFEVGKRKLPKLTGLNWKEKLYLRIGRKSYLRKIEYIIKLLKKKGFEFKAMEDYGN